MSPKPPALDRFLLAVLAIAAACWMVRSHWESVDSPNIELKLALHEKVLANEARDPYQYKLWIVSEAFEHIHEAHDVPLEDVFYGNTLLSILLLVFFHHLWLRTYVDARTAAVGTLLLAALSLTLFRGYQHHPYEFWGLALFCLMLRGIEKEWSWLWLALLGLVTGLVWEKHALLAPLWGLLRLIRRDAFWPSFGKGLVILAACLAVPVFVRLHLNSELAADVVRGAVDGDTPLHVQKWDLVAWYQGAYLLPFLGIFLFRQRVLRPWIRLLWIYLPVLVGLYLWHHYIVHETRSFYALAPVFTATACLWLASLFSTGPTTPAATPEPRARRSRKATPTAGPLDPVAERLGRLLGTVKALGVKRVADPSTSGPYVREAAQQFFAVERGRTIAGDLGRELGIEEPALLAWAAFADTLSGFLNLIDARPDLADDPTANVLALPEWAGVRDAARALLTAAKSDPVLSRCPPAR
ncbi:MAG: hypothetical protein QNJ98_03725 [Planctomycetota bacterium]|nr:hypothetical protein [Planctomycetota bacterium]